MSSKKNAVLRIKMTMLSHRIALTIYYNMTLKAIIEKTRKIYILQTAEKHLCYVIVFSVLHFQQSPEIIFHATHSLNFGLILKWNNKKKGLRLYTTTVSNLMLDGCYEGWTAWLVLVEIHFTFMKIRNFCQICGLENKKRKNNNK